MAVKHIGPVPAWAKRCSKCATTKSLDEFHAGRAWKDGKQPQCKPCVAAANAAWYARNRSSALRTTAEWYAANRGRKRRTVLAWRAAHPESRVAETLRARFRRQGGRLTRADVAAARDLAGGQCAYCLRNGGPLEIEHVIPLVRGGTNDPDNVVMSCRRCNLRKGSSGPLAMVGSRGVKTWL